jgi:hypothetical protein
MRSMYKILVGKSEGNFVILKIVNVGQSFPTSFNSRYTEQGAKVYKAHHRLFMRDIKPLLASFLLACHEHAKHLHLPNVHQTLFIHQILFSNLFDHPSNSHGTPSDPSRHTSVPRHIS